jgi:hypothetical protein
MKTEVFDTIINGKLYTFNVGLNENGNWLAWCIEGKSQKVSMCNSAESAVLSLVRFIEDPKTIQFVMKKQTFTYEIE